MNEDGGDATRSATAVPASEPRPDEAHPLRERFAEVRGEHGWARYVEDDVLAAWLRPAPRRDEPEQADQTHRSG